MPDLQASVPPLYFVECDFGKIGTAFIETDRDRNSRASVIHDIVTGQYDRGEIIRILEVREDEGACRDVTEDVANEVLQELYRLGQREQSSATDFVDRHGTKTGAGERMLEAAE